MEFSSSRETKWSFAVRQRRDRHRRRRHSGPENSTSRREIAPPARTKTASLKTFRKIKFNSETFCFFFFSFTFYEMTLSKKFFVRVLCHISLSSRVEANFKTFSSSTLIKAKIWPTTSTIISQKVQSSLFKLVFSIWLVEKTVVTLWQFCHILITLALTRCLPIYIGVSGSVVDSVDVVEATLT